MKKKLLIAFMALFTTALTAQHRTNLLSENFDYGSMPSGWTIMGDGTSNWSISNTSYAGGSADEMKFNYAPVFEGTSRLVTPAIDLTHVTAATFQLKHFLNNGDGNSVMGIATTSNNGATWHYAWSLGYNSNTEGQQFVSEVITTEDFGKLNVKFCIFFEGNSNTINAWYFDDISISTLDFGLTQTFDESSMPKGWSIFNDRYNENFGGVDNWSVSPTSYAGGSANELKLSRSPEHDGYSLLVLPVADLTGVSSVVFEFKHYLDNYTGPHTLSIVTTDNDFGLYSVAWSQEYTGGQHAVSVTISTTHFEKPGVSFGILYEGNTHNINAWYFDDIVVRRFGMGCIETFDRDLELWGIGDFWMPFGEGASNWSLSNTSYAGGNTNEFKLTRYPAFDGISRIVSPAVDLTGVSNLVFEFKHYLNNDGGTHTLGIATTTDGVTWHDAWSQTYDQYGRYSVSELVSTEDFGKPNVYFCIYYEGSSYYFSSWYFDDIAISLEGDFGFRHPEHFDGPVRPDGWFFMGEDPYKWLVLNTSYAGISANELYLLGWYPYFDGITRVVTSRVDLTNVSSLVFRFKHILENDGGTHTLGVATSTDNGATWHTAWSQTYNADGEYSVSELITTSDFGKPNVRFCIYYEGNTEYLSYWRFDDIEIIPAGGDFGFGHPEHFDEDIMPAGWFTMGEGADNWTVSHTSNAGGSANEIELNDSPYFTGISRLVSPEVDLTGVSSLVFQFRHYLDNYADLHTLGIATSSDDGATWHEAWSQNYNAGGEYSVSELITTSDFGKPNVRFCIYFEGDSYAIFGWFFDDIAIERDNVGLTEADSDTYSIYPNPANGSVKVLANDDIQTLSIYNAVGALVDRINVGANNAEINTTKYNSGVYFINVMQINGMSRTKRLVITH